MAHKHINEVKEQILAERNWLDESILKIKETVIKVKMEIKNDNKPN